MDLCASGGVLHGGTYNAQLLSMAATVATLDAVSAPGFHEELAGKTEKLREGLERVLKDAGISAHVSEFPGFIHVALGLAAPPHERSEEHTSELQSLMRISYAVFCLKNKKTMTYNT